MSGMTREEFLKMRGSDMQEFIDGWLQESRNYAMGYVPAAMLTVTGLILGELVRENLVEASSGGFRPTDRGRGFARKYGGAVI